VPLRECHWQSSARIGWQRRTVELTAAALAFVIFVDLRPGFFDVRQAASLSPFAKFN
jgi:hypothetical protein